MTRWIFWKIVRHNFLPEMRREGEENSETRHVGFSLGQTKRRLLVVRLRVVTSRTKGREGSRGKEGRKGLVSKDAPRRSWVRKGSRRMLRSTETPLRIWRARRKKESFLILRRDAACIGSKKNFTSSCWARLARRKGCTPIESRGRFFFLFGHRKWFPVLRREINQARWKNTARVVASWYMNAWFIKRRRWSMC